MTMTAKDFRMIAETIREQRPHIGDSAADALAEGFAIRLANRVAMFNYARFIAATK